MLKRSIWVLVASLAMVFSSATISAQINSLDVNSDCALVGNFGLEVLMTSGGTNRTFVADTTPQSETVYRAEFFIHPNTIMMADNTSHHVLTTREGSGLGNILRLSMQRRGSRYKIYCRTKRDTGGTYFCGKFTLKPSMLPHTRVSFEWKAASGPGANDGEVKLMKGLNVMYHGTNYDNDGQVVDTVRLGLTRIDLSMTTMGSFCLDHFSSHNDLGPLFDDSFESGTVTPWSNVVRRESR